VTAEAPISFARASRWYGPVIALNDVTVEIPPGVTGLLGPNGAGKSTFLKLTAGLLRPSQGEVRLLGRPAWGSPELFHRVGVCPETDAFWEGLTGLEFLTTLLRFTGYDEGECRHRAENALHQVDLLDAKGRKLGGYSKGMRQRVKLAQSIAHDPEVLLLDEPVSGMDPVNRRRVIDLVRRFGREGKTVVVSSHILHEVEAMAGRACCRSPSVPRGSGSPSRPPAPTSSTGRCPTPPSRRGSSRCTPRTRTSSRCSTTW
jgi:ABC-2 type transport system ATP-binding protein